MALKVISHQCEDDIVYRYSCGQLDHSTMVQVGVNQKAVLVRDGKVADVLESGSHVLSPDNIPLMMEILKHLSQDNMSAFSAQIYFFSSSYIENLKFGASLEIREYMDRKLVPEGYGVIPVTAGIRGRYILQIRDPELFLKKLLADRVVIDRAFIEHYFGLLLLPTVKTTMKRVIRQKQISIFELDEQLECFSQEVKKAVQVYFDEIGLSLIHFNIIAVDAKSNPAYQKLLEIFIREYEVIANASMNARAYKILGTTYNDRQIQRIFMTLAKNSSGNQYASAGMNMAFIKMMNEWLNHQFEGMSPGGGNGGNPPDEKPPVENSSKPFQVCPMCGKLNPVEARYCMFCSSWLDKKGGVSG